MTNHEYEKQWKILNRLGSGAQGHTYLVESVTDGSKAVLKLLNDDRTHDLKARTRMAQEALNLNVVANNGGKVPHVIDNGTLEYENLDKELYFVMDYIDGRSLNEVMREHKLLNPTTSTAISLELCHTVIVGHNNGVLHRDIKPGNIIVRSLEPADVWIVDYGISFNDYDSPANELTDTAERIGNNFTDFPERHTPGAKRLPQSDTGAICSVLFHCLTGLPPTPLRDANNLPPHRQQGREIKTIWPNDERIPTIIGVLDQGLQHSPLDRFASAEELVELLGGSPRRRLVGITDIRALLEGESRKLRSESRTVLIGSVREKLDTVFARLNQQLMSNGSVIEEFVCDVVTRRSISSSGVEIEFILPAGFEEVESGLIIQLTLRRIPKARWILLTAGMQGQSLSIFGSRSTYTTPLIGQGANIHRISTNAPFAIGNFFGSPDGNTLELRIPKVAFGILDQWLSNGLDFEPDADVLFQSTLNEIAEACINLRKETKEFDLRVAQSS